MADTTITRQLDRLARLLEEKAVLNPGALSRDVTEVARLKRIVDAIEQGAVLFKGDAILVGSALKDLSDVADGLAPIATYILQFDGTEWDAVAYPTIPTGLDDLDDVTITTPGDSALPGDIADILRWDGTKFVNQPPPRNIKAITVELPINGDDLAIWKTDAAITIVRLQIVLVGVSSPSVDWELNHTGNRSGAGTTVASGTVTNVLTGINVTSFDDATVEGGRWLKLLIGTVSGSVDEFTMTIYYTEDAR